MGSGGLSAPTTTPNNKSLHPEASIRIVFPGKKQSNAKLNHQDYEICKARLFFSLLFTGASNSNNRFQLYYRSACVFLEINAKNLPNDQGFVAVDEGEGRVLRDLQKPFLTNLGTAMRAS
jgi:hypothetical protein